MKGGATRKWHNAAKEAKTETEGEVQSSRKMSGQESRCIFDQKGCENTIHSQFGAAKTVFQICPFCEEKQLPECAGYLLDG